MAFIPTVFRFVDEDNNERLDLNDPNGWELQQGLDLGEMVIEETTLQQAPYDDEVVVGTRRPRRDVRIPLKLNPQPTWSSMESLKAQLVTELDRDTNIIEVSWQGGAPYYLDTYRAAIPSYFRGQDVPGPHVWLRDVPVIITLKAKAVMRGAGVAV